MLPEIQARVLTGQLLHGGPLPTLSVAAPVLASLKRIVHVSTKERPLSVLHFLCSPPPRPAPPFSTVPVKEQLAREGNERLGCVCVCVWVLVAAAEVIISVLSR